MKKLLLVALCVLFASSLAGAQFPTGTISGQIATREGRPAAGVRVSAMAVPETGAPVGGANALVGIGMTDEAGRYRLENVPPGRYYVVAGLVDSPTYYPGVPTTTGATSLNVLSGTPLTGINFTMAVPAGATVSGRLVRPTGEPMPATPAMRLGLLGGTSPRPEATVAADGSFQFSKVRPGSYQLFVSGVPSSQTIPLFVGENDVTGIEVPIIPTVTVLGTLSVEGDGLRPRVTISFMPVKGGTSVSGASLVAGGVFRTVLPEGEYRVGWSALPAGYELKSITSGTEDLLATNLKVTGGPSNIPVNVTLGVGGKSPWVRVGGRVNGLPGAQTSTAFRLSLAGGLQLDGLDVPVNPDGTFVFPRVLPGLYSANFSPALPVPATSLVVPNQDVTNVSITVPPLREIRGSVTNPGAGNRVFRITWTELSGSTQQFATTSTGTMEADGKFSVLMPLGERRVTMNVAGASVQSFSYGSTDLLREPLKLSSADSSEMLVTLVQTTPGAVGGVVGGTGGLVGGVLGAIITPALPGQQPPPPPPPPTPPPFRIGGDVAQASLISSVPPTYPPLAREARLQGVVLLQVEISREGVVDSVRVISGHALLNDAAVQAVQQWRYKPYMINGQPTPVVTTVTVNFTLR